MFRMKSISFSILPFSLVTILTVPTLSAQQSGAATINGTVIDPSGHPVSGCVLTLTNEAKGTMRTFTTVNDGSYSFTDIGAAVYELSTKETAGFSAYKQEISIAVGQVLRLPIQLKVGASVSCRSSLESRDRHQYNYFSCRRHNRCQPDQQPATEWAKLS